MSMISLAAGRLLLVAGIAYGGALAAAPAVAQSSSCGNAVALQAGETLAAVARKCGVTLSALIAANPQIANVNAIAAGTIINMPRGGTAQPSRPQPPAGATVRYTVRPGDTLASIARNAGVPMAAVIALNPDVDARTLRVGDVVRLPASASAGNPPPRNPPSGPITNYVVRPGDTIASIARMAGLPQAAVLALNPQLIGRTLRVGDTVRLPGGIVPIPREQVSLSAASGPVGSRVIVTGSNFPPDRRINLLVGSSAAGMEVVDQTRSDARGRVRVVTEVPEWARRRDTIYFGLRAGPRAPVVSQSFRVVRERPNPDRLTVTGTLTRQGVECQAMRGDDGVTYTLAGDLGNFRPGDRVEVTGRRAQMSTCMQGTTIQVNRIRSAE